MYAAGRRSDRSWSGADGPRGGHEPVIRVGKVRVASAIAREETLVRKLVHRPSNRLRLTTAALDRRRLLIGVLAAGGALAWPLPSRAAPADLYFEARRNGDPIGHHRVRFTEDDDRLIVDIEIGLTVTFAFIPVYRYRHQNREVWAGDRLIRLDSKTDDDGVRSWVSARADGDSLLVDSSAGSSAMPRETFPTSYWHEDTVSQEAWLDTQAGRLVRAKVEAMPAEPILAAGRTVQAKRYRLDGAISCDLWYHDGRWSKLRFVASEGSTIEYVLLASAPAAP